MKRSFLISLLVSTIAIFLIGCQPCIKDIPAGYIGKKLTPSGWDKGILEAGQVDLGDVNSDGTSTKLVMLEATSVAMKESFGQSGNNNDEEDHRILIGKTPVTVDVYVRTMIPVEREKRNAVFAQTTPVKIDERTSSITVSQVYRQFAQMDIRSGIREVLQKQTDVSYISTHIDEFNDQLGVMAIKMFERSGVPLLVQNVTLSNVKMDATVWEAENQKAAALAQVDAINKVGAALKQNPEYQAYATMNKKYDTYKELASKIGTFSIIDGNPAGLVVK